jgi:hypothetical protein
MAALDRFVLNMQATLTRNQTLFDYHQKRTGPNLHRILEHTALQELDYEVLSRLVECPSGCL